MACSVKEAKYPFERSLDPVSGTENDILSFFLKHYIPVERLEEMQMVARYETMNNMMKDDHKSAVGTITTPIVSGSVAEGLSVPVFINRETNEPIFNSDFDVLRVLPDVLASEPLVEENSGQLVRGVIVPTRHAGFVKILEKKIDDNKKQTFGYLPSSEWEIKEILRNFAMTNIQDDFTVVDHGPAMTVPGSEKVRVEMDQVYCYRCLTWPKSAEKWLARSRPSGWPEAELMKDISKDGCFVVAVGHPSSPERHLEWRLSFSSAEKKLAHTLSIYQKKAYVIFKILHREYFKSPKAIASYHLKTTFFWVCEEIPRDSWSDFNMASCVYALLDKLLVFLNCHDIPNFFIPENNMIDHIDRDVINVILKKISEVRRNVLASLFNFDMKIRLISGPGKPWKFSLNLLDHPNMRAAMEGERLTVFSLVMADVANIHITKSGRTVKGVQEALLCLEESWKYVNLVPTYDNDQETISLLRHIAENVRDMFNSMSGQPTLHSFDVFLNLLEGIFKRYEEDVKSEEFAFFHLYTGILYHCKAFWDARFDSLANPDLSKLNSVAREEAKQKAESHFHIVCNEHEECLLEASKFLYQIGKYEKAQQYLEKLVTRGDYEPFQITKVELPTVEKNLMNLASDYINANRRSLILPGAVVTYYYQCLAYLALNEKPKASQAAELLSVYSQAEGIENAKLCQDLYERIKNEIEKH